MKELLYVLVLLPALVCGQIADAPLSVENSAPSERLAAYKAAGDWRRFAELIDTTIKARPPRYGEHLFANAVGVGLGGDPWALNVLAWDVFMNCEDRTVLQRALRWSDFSIRISRPRKHPETESYPVQTLDTRANLLYKLGRVDQAIGAELAAIAEDNAIAKSKGREKGGFFDEYSATLEKMRRGERTWTDR